MAKGVIVDARGRALVLLALAALLLHGLLLGGIDLASPQPGPAPPAALQVRAIVAPPPAPPLVDTPAVIAVPPPARRPARPVAVEPVPPPPQPVAVPALQLAITPTEPPVAETVVPPEPVAAVASSADVAAAPVSAVDAPVAGGEAPPVYRTQLPPPLTLRYALQRGRLSGSGELAWRPDGARYELRLDGTVIGLNVLTQLSQGAIDANGLAPVRFTDQRARRAAVAANFQREAGKITFSGPSTEYPLWPGVQDRLSWMLQLAGVAAAEPQLLESGERIVLQVVGARGDAGAWAFRSVGREPLDTAAGPADTWHLRREARGPYDSAVEVWLDPQRHFLPVRATLGGGDDTPIELRLRELIPGS